MSKTNIDKFIKKDKLGKYYLIDSDIYKTNINGISRMEAFYRLVDDKIINIKKINKIGVVNFVKTINSILDGNIEIGRFKFYVVYENGLTLEEQLKIEQNKYIKGVDGE